MAKQKIRRRQLIVHGPLQAKIMINAALLPFLILTLNTILVTFFCWSLSEEAVTAGVELPSAQYLLVASGTFLLASSGFIAIYVLILSHRIAGPMFGIAKVLTAIREGETSRRCNLRKHDLLAPLGEDINEFLDWLEPNLETQGALDKATASEDAAAETNGGPVDPDTIASALDAEPSETTVEQTGSHA